MQGPKKQRTAHQKLTDYGHTDDTCLSPHPVPHPLQQQHLALRCLFDAPQALQTGGQIVMSTLLLVG